MSVAQFCDSNTLSLKPKEQKDTVLEDSLCSTSACNNSKKHKEAVFHVPQTIMAIFRRDRMINTWQKDDALGISF